jgi:2-hydroxychromene-2-carboxylate isomerase
MRGGAPRYVHFGVPSGSAPMTGTTFYFDLGSPYAYLSAERLAGRAQDDVRWQPILLGGLFKLNGRSSWALGDHMRRQAGMAEVERRARAYGLPAIHWPDPWPHDYLFAMRAATYAFTERRGREFTREAFAEAFARGRDLAVPAHVLDAAQRADLDPELVRTAVAAPAIKQALREATEAAHAQGVFGVPTVEVAGELFWGDDRLEEALAQAPPASTPVRDTRRSR